MYFGGVQVVNAIGNVTLSTDRPLTDVLAYGMRTPNAIVAGIQTYEVSMDIPGDPDPSVFFKQAVQSFFDADGAVRDSLFDAGGIFEAELPNEDMLDQIPVILYCQGLDARLLETGTPITDVIVPFISEVYYGITVRQLLSMVDLGEAAYKKNVTVRPLMRHMLNGPVAVDVFNLADKDVTISPELCAFQLTNVPLRLIDGQYAFVMVDNEIWHSGFWYDAVNRMIVFDQDNGYCPEAPIALFLREEQTIAAAAATLDNVPMADALKVTNEFDTEEYIEVTGAPAIGEYSIAGGVLTFNAAENGNVIHAHYFHQSASVPFKNITIIYVITNPGIHAGDPYFAMTGAL